LRDNGEHGKTDFKKGDSAPVLKIIIYLNQNFNDWAMTGDSADYFIFISKSFCMMI
jgi:hypothetical protein